MDTDKQMGDAERGIPSSQEFSPWGICVLSVQRDDSDWKVSDVQRVPKESSGTRNRTYMKKKKPNGYWSL